MPRWKNFSIWKGRLPHWRADGETYYVTFRHKRPLAESEARELLRQLLKSNGKKWDIKAAVVVPEKTELLTVVRQAPHGSDYELSALVERAQRAAGKTIMKATGERYPPFWAEPYDHIVRDEEDLMALLTGMSQTSREAGLPQDHPGVWFDPEIAAG